MGEFSSRKSHAKDTKLFVEIRQTQHQNNEMAHSMSDFLVFGLISLWLFCSPVRGDVAEWLKARPC